MSQAYALDRAPYGQSNSAYKREARLVVCVTFVAGVPTINTARSASGFTFTGDTGVYTGTMPKSARGIVLTQMLTATVGAFATVTTFNPTAGTFSIGTWTATNAALDVATGDELLLYFILEGG